MEELRRSFQKTRVGSASSSSSASASASDKIWVSPQSLQLKADVWTHTVTAQCHAKNESHGKRGTATCHRSPTHCTLFRFIYCDLTVIDVWGKSHSSLFINILVFWRLLLSQTKTFLFSFRTSLSIRAVTVRRYTVIRAIPWYRQKWTASFFMLWNQAFFSAPSSCHRVITNIVKNKCCMVRLYHPHTASASAEPQSRFYAEQCPDCNADT